MKLNKIFLLAGIALVGVFASCDNDDDYTPGEQPKAGFQKFAFSEDQNLELAPEDPTTVTLTATRAIFDQAAEVPVTVLVNDGNVFQVPQTISFSAGDSISQFTVNFPNAEIGKTYNLTISVEDPNYTSAYSSNKTVSVSVVRVKWNPAGYYLNAAGSKVEGYVMFTEDFLTTFYGVQNNPYAVKMEERDDQPGLYRLVNPFGANYPYNDPGDWDDSKDYYMYIDATDPEHIFIPRYDSEMAWSYGQFTFYSLAAYYLDRNRPDDAEDYYGYIENGSIVFPTDALLIAMAEYNNGSLYQANSNGAFRVVIDPSKNLYEANVDEDFDYAPLWEGQIESGILNATRQFTIFKGVCNKNVDDCDKRFAEEFGAPYIIKDAFADGYDILFCAKDDGTITVPKDYESQETGLLAPYGKAIFANIFPSASTWTGEAADLRITFTSNTQAAQIDTFGVSNEIFEHITYSEVGTGTYTYSDMFFANEGETAEDPGLPLFICDQDPTRCYIDHWGYNAPLYFTWDQENSYVEVLQSFTGYTHPSYGDTYIVDAAEKGFDPSYYDEATKTFYFMVGYRVDAGWFDYGKYETFCIDGSVAPSNEEVKARRATPVKKQKGQLKEKNHSSFYKFFSTFKTGSVKNITKSPKLAF